MWLDDAELPLCLVMATTHASSAACALLPMRSRSVVKVLVQHRKVYLIRTAQSLATEARAALFSASAQVSKRSASFSSSSASAAPPRRQRRVKGEPVRTARVLLVASAAARRAAAARVLLLPAPHPPLRLA